MFVIHIMMGGNFINKSTWTFDIICRLVRHCVPLILNLFRVFNFVLSLVFMLWYQTTHVHLLSSMSAHVGQSSNYICNQYTQTRCFALLLNACFAYFQLFLNTPSIYSPFFSKLLLKRGHQHGPVKSTVHMELNAQTDPNKPELFKMLADNAQTLQSQTVHSVVYPSWSGEEWTALMFSTTGSTRETHWCRMMLFFHKQWSGGVSYSKRDLKLQDTFKK